MIPPIGVKIFGRDTLSSKLGTLQRKLQKFGQSAKQVGQAMSVGLSVPMGLFAYNTLKTAGDFEYGMNRVRAITSATGKDFDILRQRAKHYGETTTFTAGQVTEGMQMLAQAGLPVNDIYESIGTVLKGAQANMVDMSESANIGAGLMRTFGYEGKEMITVMDMLTKTSMSSMTNFSELAEAFLYAGPTAGAMGKTLKETSAVLGSLANGMMRGSMAGTSLRGMMAKLTAPSAQAVGIMQNLGIAYDDILDKQGNLKSFIDVIKAFESTNVTAGQVLQIFGLRAGPGFQILLNQGSEALRVMTDTIGDFAGTTEKISKVQMAGFRGQLFALKSAFEGFEIAIADSGILEWATKAAVKFTEFFRMLAQAHPKLLRFGFIIGLAVAVIGPLLVAIGALSAAVAAISVPVLVVVAAIVALTGWLGALVYWWDEVVDFTTKWGWALNFIMGPIGIVIWAVSNLIKYWDELIEALKSAFEWIEKISIKFSESKFGEWVVSAFSGTPGEAGAMALPYDVAGLMQGITAEQKPKAQINVNIPNAPRGTEVTAESEDIETSVEQGLAFEY